MRRHDGTTEINGGYWRSLQELAGDEEFRRFLDAEFPAEAGASSGLSRRRFLQLMSASIAMATLAGCRWPEEKIVPFAHRAEGVTPGEVKKFATTLETAGIAAAVVVTSYDGRPIKIEGNPAHPASLGAADLHAQARILELYDPDRSRSLVQRQGRQTMQATWEDFAAFAGERFGRTDGGAGLAVLSEPFGSAGLQALKTVWQERFPAAVWYEYEPASPFGPPILDQVGHHLDLQDARVIVDLDADILGRHPTALRNARQFAALRRPESQKNRLYVFEPGLSRTGAVADHRFPVSQADIPFVLSCLAAELVHLEENAGSAAKNRLAPLLDHPARPAAVRAIARDLLSHQGRGLLVLGPHHPAEVQTLCHQLNEMLGNSGNGITYYEQPRLRRAGAYLESITGLCDAMRQGRVQTVLMLGGNPVYDAPVDLEFASALAGVEQSVHLSLFANETSRACTWHLPQAHPLESWDILRDIDGTVCAVQPLIEPLYGGKTAPETLSLILETPPRKAHDITRQAFHAATGGQGPAPADDPGFETRWREFLNAGYLKDSGTVPAESLRIRWRGGLPQFGHVGLGADNLELVFAPDSKLLDGRFANNGWLQELPDAMTKLTWDNAAILSPATAAELHLKHGDMVTLHYKNRRLDMPVYLLPGQARYSVTVNLGYGRTAAGRIGDGVGFDTYKLRTSDAPWGGPGLRITRTGRRHELACTQDHFAIDARGTKERERRVGPLVREGDLEHYRQHPDFARHMGMHHPPLVSLWREHEYEGHRWAMAIDLNLCIGCNACVVACQAENNIPIVGKQQVRNGREMHWLRLDRYFKGDPERPRVALQPVGCMHCEMAPCEQVCPVAATVHSQEGLNTMVYNRCVGTRYCSNNCPYKVRRFNFFNYQKKLTPTQKMAYNPDVTVRSRGVMEKCTYCVQRIQAARIRAKNARRPLRDGDIVPACAQTCPTGAIVFGDLNDETSRVGRLHADPRAYAMLAELNVKPRTAYLARVFNPNPDLDGNEHEPVRGHDGHG